MLSTVSQSGRCAGLSLQAWVRARWDGANWVLQSASGFSGIAGSVFTFTSAQPDTNYVLDIVHCLYSNYPVTVYPNVRNTGSFTLAVGANGSGSSGVAGDTIYIGVYR